MTSRTFIQTFLSSLSCYLRALSCIKLAGAAMRPCHVDFDKVLFLAVHVAINMIELSSTDDYISNA